MFDFNEIVKITCFSFYIGLIFLNIRLYFFSHHDVTPITMALNGASSSPSACQALASMLSRNTLNPADISVLFRNYSTIEPPPIELLRNPQFLGNKVHLFIMLQYYYS